MHGGCRLLQKPRTNGFAWRTDGVCHCCDFESRVVGANAFAILPSEWITSARIAGSSPPSKPDLTYFWHLPHTGSTISEGCRISRLCLDSHVHCAMALHSTNVGRSVAGRAVGASMHVNTTVVGRMARLNSAARPGAGSAA